MMSEQTGSNRDSSPTDDRVAWVASRLWIILLAIGVAACLRELMPRDHRHLVSRDTVGFLALLTAMAAGAATAIAGGRGFWAGRATDCPVGTLALTTSSGTMAVLLAWGLLARCLPAVGQASFFVLLSVLLLCGVAALVALVTDSNCRPALAALGLNLLLLAGMGISVPVFSKNISEAPRAKAQQDLDTLRNAITLHDSQNRPLTGTSLRPLLGRYLQEIPRGPWGSDYLLDTSVGVIVSFGADRKLGGVDENEDFVVRYKPRLRIQRARLKGEWGALRAGAQLHVQWTKPYTVADPAVVPRELVLVIDPRSQTCLGLAGVGLEVEPTDFRSLPRAVINREFGQTWGAVRWLYSPGDSHPRDGLMVLRCEGAPTTTPPENHIRLKRGMALDVTLKALSPAEGGGERSTSPIREGIEPGGPFDPLRFKEAALPADGAYPHELIGSERRGVEIQRMF